MEIKLDFITGQDGNGEDTIETRTFVQNHPKAFLIRRATVIEQENDLNHITPDSLDIIADFICEIYHNKFTRDELYNGLDSAKLLPAYKDSTREIIYGVTSRLDTFPEE